MKKLFTFFLGLALSAATLSVQAQDVATLAETQTKEMASVLKLNDAEKKKLKAMNFNRLAKIEALAGLREQDSRYLDLRLDEIEEDYHSELYSLLRPKQYAAFMDYKKDQPYTYASVIAQQKNIQARTIAIQTED